MFPGLGVPRDAVPGTPGAGAKTVRALRRLTLLSIGQLLVGAVIVAVVPENLLPGPQGDPVGRVLTGSLIAVVLGAPLLAFLVHRVLRSPAASFLGLRLPDHPLARYRWAKTIGIALLDAAGSFGFVVGLLIADGLAYAAILVAVLGLAFLLPRLAHLPPEAPDATTSPVPG